MTQSQSETNIEATLVEVVDRLDKLSTEVKNLSTDVEKSNDKFEIYRQANQAVVNLAFSLIASATIGLVVSLVFKR
ncbi:MAG: hypothetical protein WBB28_27215 [Crinalium sp.]